MKYFSLSLVLVFLFCLSGQAQHISDKAGKKYYSDEKDQLKEVFSYKEVNILNPRDPKGEVKTKIVKHGPYFKYYKNGDLEIGGHYKDGKKDGEWKYYSKEGKLEKIEHYKKGTLKDTNNDPEQPEDVPENAESMDKKIEQTKDQED